MGSITITIATTTTSSITTVALVIEYNGSGFHGWQKQPGLRTVQSVLHEALETITRENIQCVHAAGRTDAGVHALGQVISFNVKYPLNLERLSYSLSSLLKGEVAVVRAAIMPNFFHPRKGVRRKKYLYRIVNRRTPLTHDYGRAWHVAAPLPLVHLQQELEPLIGEHDFTSFRAAGCQARSSVKIIDGISVSNHGDELRILVEGSGFLKHMVRIIVGTAVARVKGWPKLPQMFDILMSRRRAAAGPTAPAHGLTLAEVNYYDWPATQEWKASHR